jgi:AraC-like DNA-binding protein
MNDDKLFKNNLLSLNELSKKVGVPSHHLSQVINETTGKSFFEYLALYRIEEAKKSLSSDKHNLTIENCRRGWDNSKSAFNKIFKKHTGLTPPNTAKILRNRVPAYKRTRLPYRRITIFKEFKHSFALIKLLFHKKLKL